MTTKEVVHPRYGRGVVLQRRHKGFELLVEFDGVRRWVRIDELREAELLPPAPRFPPAPEPDEHFKSRRMIEAFRLGIVPYDCVEDFTFGREQEVKQIAQWLSSQSEQSGTMLVVGEYGSGKTHLLHYALGRALQEGYAVSWVEMDPNEAPFHKPKRVYKQLIQNMRYPLGGTSVGNFRDFLKRALSLGALKDHEYFKRIMGHEFDETLWEWIEAREPSIRPWSFYNWTYNSLPGLYDYSTAANIYCYLLSALGWAAREVMSLKGLLLVFDEAETVEMNYYSYQAERSRNFLRALIRTADNEPALQEKPWNSGLDYCGVGVGPRIPFLYEEVSGLKLLFAFTSLDWNYYYSWTDGYYSKTPYIPEIERIPKSELEPLSEKALRQVFEHICLLYDSAYDYLEEDVTIDAIFNILNQSIQTRLFVKGAVEILDIARFLTKS